VLECVVHPKTLRMLDIPIPSQQNLHRHKIVLYKRPFVHEKEFQEKGVPLYIACSRPPISQLLPFSKIAPGHYLQWFSSQRDYAYQLKLIKTIQILVDKLLNHTSFSK